MQSRILFGLFSLFIFAFVVATCVIIVMFSPTWSMDPVAMTTQGVVRGSWSDDGEYVQYLGIPYALVNRDNPFGDALPGPIFEETFIADDDSAICPQVEEFNNTVVGTLNCLHVNVYVPKSASISNPLPVMINIHGGGFLVGFDNQYVYGPKYIVRHDVILVTINYRVGIYGFMCLDTPEIPGNAGLKDQRRALRWIKDNIAAFGGDSSKITAFGQSVGGTSIDFHMLYSDADNFFDQVILQSGTAFMEIVITQSRPSVPIEIVENLGFEAQTVEEALEILKSTDTHDVIQAVSNLGIWSRPCKEQQFEGVEIFMTELPYEFIAAGAEYASKPMMIGYAEEENLLPYLTGMNNPNFFEQMGDVFETRIRGLFRFPSESMLQNVANTVKEFYLGTDELNGNTVYALIDFDSDSQFIYPTEMAIQKHMENSNNPIYQYMFSYVGELNFVRRLNNITEGGAAHGDEIGYLFKQIYTPDENSVEDQLMIDCMTTMWTNFAKHGNPTPETSELLPVLWPPAAPSREYLRIDSELSIHQKPLHERIAFWDLLFETYGGYYIGVWPIHS